MFVVSSLHYSVQKEETIALCCTPYFSLRQRHAFKAFAISDEGIHVPVHVHDMKRNLFKMTIQYMYRRLYLYTREEIIVDGRCYMYMRAMPTHTRRFLRGPSHKPGSTAIYLHAWRPASAPCLRKCALFRMGKERSNVGHGKPESGEIHPHF